MFERLCGQKHRRPNHYEKGENVDDMFVSAVSFVKRHNGLEESRRVMYRSAWPLIHNIQLERMYNELLVDFAFSLKEGWQKSNEEGVIAHVKLQTPLTRHIMGHSCDEIRFTHCGVLFWLTNAQQSVLHNIERIREFETIQNLPFDCIWNIISFIGWPEFPSHLKVRCIRCGRFRPNRSY